MSGIKATAGVCVITGATVTATIIWVVQTLPAAADGKKKSQPVSEDMLRLALVVRFESTQLLYLIPAWRT